MVTDSISCLTSELVEQYDIGIIPINIYAGGKLYKDWVDITPTEVYKLFLEDPESFKTSAASPEDCLQAFRSASRRAASILCITVSAKLSMMYNAACDARELARTELPDTTIEVMDSYSATPSEGMVALAAARAAADGKEMAEVTRTAEEIRDKVGAIVFLDTIRHVYRSGRIPKIASQIGSMLNIKPLLTVSKVVNFAGMARNRKQGIERMLQMMRDRVGDSPVHVSVTHAYALNEAEKLKERVASEFNCVEMWLSEFSPVMGYACGTGTVGVAFYPEG
ncbi:MAG TPA: DegV family protein [Dehalococcoidales bacterium]|nr:DegV family protein [Dehalococcoidales bacterium]